MSFLQTIVRYIWARWPVRLLYAAACFWSIDTLLSIAIGWKRTPEGKIVACLLIGCLVVLLERLWPSVPSESRERYRIVGLVVGVVILAAALLMTVLEIA
jgi:hypothetical protein